VHLFARVWARSIASLTKEIIVHAIKYQTLQLYFGKQWIFI